ncbi:site-specific integrase [Dictyobacter sp. S3.2.2.5]|uniref:Site-specific integrase n=1 Tax=Dictyobacter halimunensis TaxID=3026934 RepID=A0ABQ6FUY0_9CHLR|nr:site-specific integrase [Dictyobacter sp. S3.2.2.5]
MAKEKKKHTRRDQGEGSITKRSDGRWAVSIRIRGKRIFKYAKDEKEAKAILKTLKKEIEQGVKPDAPKFTVASYLEYWLQIHRAGIRDSTYITYTTCIKQIILALGSHRLSSLSGDQIQLGYIKIQKDLELSFGTMKLTHTIFRAALNDAVKWGYIAMNPARHVEVSKIPRTHHHALTIEQAKQLLRYTDGDTYVSNQMTCLLTLAIATGMRRGEMLGLKWGDIDMDSKTVFITRTVSYLTVDGQTKYIETPPKTDYSKRRIQIPDFVMAEIQKQKVRQAEQRLKAGPGWEARDLVFSNAFGSYFNPRSVSRYFELALKKAGLEHIRFHDLRHSAASILMAMNVHPKVVQELLGHSSISITMNIYSHTDPSLQRQAMDDLDTKFKPDNEDDDDDKNRQ